MPLFKRKAVTLLPPPNNLKDEAEVWVVKATGEVFTEYEKYLKRLDYLSQKKFTDSVNGKSGLTYADAVESEGRSSADIDTLFPEVLRDPILRKVQFSTVSRMDELVNWVFDAFKREFFPGEDVIITPDDGEANPGTIREKAKFPMIRGPDGSVQREAFSRYFIRLQQSPNDEALVDEKHLRRDRKVFTKLNLRAFLKNSLEREAWIGAPWLAKEHLAIHYRLPMEIPQHLFKDAHVLANKQQMLQSKPRGRHPKNMPPEEIARLQQEEMRMQQMRPPGAPMPHPSGRSQAYAQPPPPPKPAPIKYPIEDLDLPIRNLSVRPQLKFLTEELSHYFQSDRKHVPKGIQTESVGKLLEVWNTLNVQAEVYVLDSFTFDDFLDAMNYHSAHVTRCELLDEMFCAVLKQLVSDKGKIEVNLPRMPVETEEDSEEDVDDSTVSTPVNDVPARSTRSRLSHVENVSEQLQSPAAPPVKAHRAQEALADFNWVEALSRREMEDGGWQLILIGVLNQLSHSPQFKAECDYALAHLVPMHLEPTKENIVAQFDDMSADLRIAALQPITLMSVATRALKDFMEACSEDQTDVRKRKLEFQREKRVIADNLSVKDRERMEKERELKLAEEVAPPEPSVDTTDVTIESNGAGSSEPEDDAPTGGRSLRRGNDRKRKRDEETTRKNKEREAEKAKLDAKEAEKKKYQVMVRDCDLYRQQIRDLEASIAECDGDLREADVHRTRLLGKDRYCNRYYWFERNGQPFGGLPTSSTADAGYANGRLWVQGPGDMEREGFIDLPRDEEAAYAARFGMSVPQRRKMEEGPTSLANASEWGFYDDPDSLDHLIGWTNDLGEREKRLRIELQAWKLKISQYMTAHRDYLQHEAAKKLEAEEEPQKGIATRRKTQEESVAASERCLKWSNGMARDQNKHLHCQDPPRKKVKELKKVVPGMVGRSGKPLTRQGK